MIKQVKIRQLILKKSRHLDRMGGGGVNPYGQPDRKKTVFLRLPLQCTKIFKLYQVIFAGRTQ